MRMHARRRARINLLRADSSGEIGSLSSVNGNRRSDNLFFLLTKRTETRDALGIASRVYVYPRAFYRVKLREAAGAFDLLTRFV